MKPEAAADAGAMLAAAIDHHRNSRWRAAAEDYRRALDAGAPATGQLLEAVAAVSWQGGFQAEAAVRWRQAVALAPDAAMSYRNLGVAAADAGDPEAAVISHLRAAACLGAHPLIWTAVASAYRDCGRLPSATAAWRRALALSPAEADALFDLGVAVQAEDRWLNAVVLYRRSIAVDPGRAATHGNLGVCLSELNRTAEALSAFRVAAELEPSVFRRRHALHLEYLKAGDFGAAWATIADPDMPTLGELGGRSVLLYETAGYGDVIQFMRYAPMVRNIAEKLWLEVPAALLGLARTMVGAENVIAAGQPRPAHDIAFRLLDLPRLFGTTAATVPADGPYLAADSEAVRAWAPRIGRDRRLAVGIAWAGDSSYPLDRLRSPGLDTVRPLLDLDFVRFHALQLGVGRSDLERRPLPAEIFDLGTGVRDFGDTAAIVAGLDLVVTPCTALAHLAGAMGKPTWIMLRYASDWRWMLGRDDSPWYPSVRLFRQPKPGDWPSVIARLSKALLAQSLPGCARLR